MLDFIPTRARLFLKLRTSLLGYNVTSILQIEIEFKTRRFCGSWNLGFRGDVFVRISFNRLPNVRIRIRSHRHPCNISHHVIYIFEDSSSLEASNSTVRDDREWISGQPSQEASNKMGEGSVQDMFDHVNSVSRKLSSCVFLIYITILCSSCSCNFIHVGRDINTLFILANSAVNPFVYAWRFENIRKAIFKLMLGCRDYRKRRTFDGNPESN